MTRSRRHHDPSGDPSRTLAASGPGEFLRLRSVVDAVVRIAEHAGDTGSFLSDSVDVVMGLTRATGAVVLLADGPLLTVAVARGQMEQVDPRAFDGGQTLTQACLSSHAALHSESTYTDSRIDGPACRKHKLRSLIATPLRYGDNVLGVLEVCSSVTHAFDEIDARAVALVGNTMGGALGRQMALEDNTRLLSRLEAALMETQATARKYQDAALYDALTGLPNRAHFLARLEEFCQVHQGQHNHFAVLFLDLDGFKEINDTHGHATGDAVLRETAVALRSCVRDNDLVARLGGDEFVVLLSSLRDAERDAERISVNIQTSLGRTRTIEGVSVQIRTSVGWAAYDGTASADSVLAAADAAMYLQKKSRYADRAV